MKYIETSIRNVPVIEEYDVVIVGGGTAGAVAAVSCGREKLKTLVVEQFGALGGTQTQALVTPVMPTYIKGEPSSTAIGSEIKKRMSKRGFCEDDWFDPIMLKFVLEEMVVEANCEILYYTVLVDIVKNDNKIEYIIIHNKNGLSAVKAKRFIDCSGDADLACLAGVPVESGNQEGINQSASLRFEMANVDLERCGDYLQKTGQEIMFNYPLLQINTIDAVFSKGFKALAREKHEQGLLTELDISHLQMFSVPGKPGNINFNCPEVGKEKNIIEAGCMTQKQIEGKKAILRIVRFMKENVPGFEKAYICEIAPMLGIRESRRIHAEYQFSFDDVLDYRKFDDGIAKSNYPVDIHGGLGSDKISKSYRDVSPDQKYFEVPYRSIVPLKVENLLVAGRCAGFDFFAQSAVRVQFTCQAMGEAAGIASRLSIEQNTAFKDVDGSKVREAMRNRGAML